MVTKALETDTPTLKTPALHSARSRESIGAQSQNSGTLQVGDTTIYWYLEGDTSY